MSWSAGLLPAPLNSAPGFKALEQAINTPGIEPDPRDFGIGRNLGEDQTPFINTALRQLSTAGGGRLRLQGGRLILASRIKAQIGTRIVGRGAGFNGLPTFPQTTLVLAPGYTDTAVVSIRAFEDAGGVLFLNGVGLEDLGIDYLNAPTCGATAVDLKSVSNCGPWRNVTVYNQDVGQALALGISQVAGAQPCEGLSFHDWIASSASVDPTDVGPCVAIGGAHGVASSTTVANEILFSGCKFGRKGSGAVNVAGSAVMDIDSGSTGINIIACSLTGREKGIRIRNSAGTQPLYIQTFGNTFEGYRYGVAVDGTAGQPKVQFVTCVADRFVNGSTTGVNPRNYLQDYGSSCQYFPTEAAPGSSVAVEFTANAQASVAWADPDLVVNASADCVAFGRRTGTVGMQSSGSLTHGSTTLLRTTVGLANGAAGAAGTLANAPIAGNPTKWVPVDDNGVTRYAPLW